MLFGSTILEVAMGLVFIYLLLSLVCTAVNELTAALITWRARNLAQGIRNLLNGYDDRPWLMRLRSRPGGEAGSLAEALYQHPLVRSLYLPGGAPSYIPSRTFAVALLELAFQGSGQRPTTIEGMRRALGDSRAPPHLKQVLFTLIDQADEAIETGLKLKDIGVVDPQRLESATVQVRERIEVWFNDSMERVAGWYKRKMQALTFVVSVSLTVALNVDTIVIMQGLSTSSALRESVVASAEARIAQPAYVIVPSGDAQPQNREIAEERETAAETAIARAYKDINALSLPIGWASAEGSLPSRPSGWLWKLLGLFLTAMSVSLGAPFWFDMLNKVMTIRSAGKAPEEAPKSPKAVPRPIDPSAPVRP
jgi:hypothetical protein